MAAQLIVALDVTGLGEARAVVRKLGDLVGYYKVGSQLFTQAGSSIIEMLKEERKKIFLDLKFHDIPQTVAAAAESAAALGVTMFNVHAAGGLEMMQAAANAVARFRPHPLVLGVTVLTSQTSASLRKLGIQRSVTDQVIYLARLACDAGLDGVVASPKETRLLRCRLGGKFVILTPGIRPDSAKRNDQKRVMTPRQAVAAGADYLVVGRPILAAKSPMTAARCILREMGDV